MFEQECVPFAPSLIESKRSLGYSFPSAVIMCKSKSNAGIIFILSFAHAICSSISPFSSSNSC